MFKLIILSAIISIGYITVSVSSAESIRTSGKVVYKVYKHLLKTPRYFYSNCPMDVKKYKSPRCKGIRNRPSIEHIVTMKRINEHFKCTKGRNACIRSNPEIRRCSANPFNLVPVLLEVNQARGTLIHTSDRINKGEDLKYNFKFLRNDTHIKVSRRKAFRIAMIYKYMQHRGCVTLTTAEDVEFTATLLSKSKFGGNTIRQQKIDLILHYEFPQYSIPKFYNDDVPVRTEAK